MPDLHVAAGLPELFRPPGFLKSRTGRMIFMIFVIFSSGLHVAAGFLELFRPPGFLKSRTSLKAA